MKQTKYGKTSTFPGNGWRRFDINRATKVDPNNIDDGSSDTGGQDGATTLKVDSPVDCRLLSQGMFWYKPISLTCDDIATIGIILDFPDATSGAPETVQADKIYCSAGVTSDPAAMATRAFGAGIEHDATADMRGYTEQSGIQSFAAGSASGRHFEGTILKSSNSVKKIGSGFIINNSGAFVGGTVQNSVTLTPAASSDPLYIFLFVGTGAAVTFERRVQMFFNVSQKYRIS